MRAAILTISSSRSDGDKPDESGPALVRFAQNVGAEVAAAEIVPDKQSEIEWALRHYSDTERCELVLTTGGTGFAPDDVTPEATRAVIEREAPGIAEALRAASREHTRNWMLSRGVAGIRGRSLIINFPGNPKSIGEAGEAIAEAIPHAVSILRDGAGHRHDGH
jgi:molybdenum cofactor synthesis domain-containing protein